MQVFLNISPTIMVSSMIIPFIKIIFTLQIFYFKTL
jgi:hypothetical protein